MLHPSSSILSKKKSLHRILSAQSNLLETRIAILSGSTIGNVKDVLELFLLQFGIKPQFYTGQYNRFYEDVIFENPALADFKPDLIYIPTSVRNLSDPALPEKLEAVWAKIAADYACLILQNNFELPPYGMAIDNAAINALNLRLADRAKSARGFYVHDLQAVSARFGIISSTNTPAPSPPSRSSATASPSSSNPSTARIKNVSCSTSTIPYGAGW